MNEWGWLGLWSILSHDDSKVVAPYRMPLGYAGR